MMQADLHHLFEHKGDTLYWKNPKAHRCKAGDVAGSKGKDGYMVVNFAGKKTPAHRIVWALHNGPTDMMIDHINGNRCDNRLENLRLVTEAQNHMNTSLRSNNTSGTKGVRWHAQRGKWNARIKLNGVERSLGMFSDIKDAVSARMGAELKFFGKYSRHYDEIMRQVEAGTLVIQEADA